MPHWMQMPQTPISEGLMTGQTEWLPPVPTIDEDESLSVVIRELSQYFIDAIEAPHTFEQLRTSSVGHILKPLVISLSDRCHHPGIISALMVLKLHFHSFEPDDRGVYETRGWACEIVAWRFLSHLSENELINYLLCELAPTFPSSDNTLDVEEPDLQQSFGAGTPANGLATERTRLLFDERTMPAKVPDIHVLPQSQTRGSRMSQSTDDDPAMYFVGLNALEIATIAGAKRFLSQRVVQNVINGIWNGDIVFWDSLNTHTRKKAQFYHKKKTDMYCRLRVPKYQKTFEAVFFAIFLVLYYAVLWERNPGRITFVEVLLYIWILAFACDEFGEIRDAGTLFYSFDFWSLWDIGIIAIGAAYLVARVIALVRNSNRITDISFDILSLEALFLVPRVCALLSLHPYFGTLIPCLKEMTKDFVKFLGIVAILFVGFLTTFTMLARDSFKAKEIWWTMVNVFFGSSYLGFDIASKISPALGPTLMVFFVILANILLLTSLIAILSQSLTKVMDHAREEYLFQYSVFVLEASASRRLTYYFPPLNLIPLTLFRPLRLFVNSEQLRSARIILLKATHLPYVGAIWAYERTSRFWNEKKEDWLGASGTQKRAMIASHISFSHKAMKYPAHRNRSEVSLMAKRRGSETRPNSAKETEMLTETRKMMEKLKWQGEMIEKLSEQVETLTRRIAPEPKDEGRRAT